MPSKLLRTIVVAILAAGSAMHGVATGGESVTTKRVLLLFSHKTTAPVNADWDRGVRRVLGSGFPDGVKIDVEYLDLHRSDEEYYLAMVDLLRRKYSNVQIDLVIPFYVQASEFVLEQRELFGDAPIVFCSVPIGLSDRFRSVPGTTGVVFKLDFVDTVDVARTLFPDARRLHVFSGASDGDQAFMRWAQASLRRYEDEIKIEYLSGVPLREFLDKVEGSEDRSLVLILSYAKDIHGRDYTTVETVEILAEQSMAPVFGVYDTLLGHGIVGGRLTRIIHGVRGNIGFSESEMTRRIDDGARARTAPFPPRGSDDAIRDDWDRMDRINRIVSQLRACQ
jgi:hypothetical protein